MKDKLPARQAFVLVPLLLCGKIQSVIHPRPVYSFIPAPQHKNIPFLNPSPPFSFFSIASSFNVQTPCAVSDHAVCYTSFTLLSTPDPCCLLIYFAVHFSILFHRTNNTTTLLYHTFPPHLPSFSFAYPPLKSLICFSPVCHLPALFPN